MTDTPSTSALLAEIPRLAAELEPQIDPIADVIEAAYRADRQVFTIGNGGSASNASHFAQDLVKATVIDGWTRRIRATALTDNIAHITAIANDMAYAWVFEQQLRTFADDGDVLIAFSGSGNSNNVLFAARFARTVRGMQVVAFTGRDGGALKTAWATTDLHVPCEDMGVIESMHCLAFHLVVTELRERLRSA